RRHTRSDRDWSSDVCSSDLNPSDHPLASHFEECDSLLIFDDVVVPWERVFAYNNVALSNALYPDTNLRQYTGHQTAVRALVKLRSEERRVGKECSTGRGAGH